MAVVKGIYIVLFFMSGVVFPVSINPPRLRPSPYFGCVSGLSYADIDDLGDHHYEGSFWEQNALLYTAKAGYIDMGHLRESADRARYIFEICQENILLSNTLFHYDVIEPAIYHVSLEYPEGWDELPPDEKQVIARQVALELGQRFAHLSTVWHEIVTWYGYASIGFLSEKASSFSWEDGYSDLLGTKLAAMALKENDTDYNKAMTEVILRELKKLDPQPVVTGRKATAIIKGKWYSGRYPLLSMKRRNFDVGFGDGSISPFRVPGICDNAVAEPCTIPPLEAIKQHGFTMHLTMTPKESERTNVLRIIKPDDGETLEPEKDFPKVIKRIRKSAIRLSGKNVDKPIL